MFSKGDLMGKVTISYYDNKIYSILNTFNDSWLETIFYLYTIDGVLVKVAEPSRQQNMAAMLARYFEDINDGRNEISNFVNLLTMKNSGGDNLLIKAEYDLRKKKTIRGEDINMRLNTSPLFIEDINTKLITTMLLYTVDIHNRFNKHDASTLSSLYIKMLSIYLKEGFPKSISQANVPAYIIKSHLLK